jgi:chromate reductase
MKFLAFAGSLREKSYNRMLIQAVKDLTPPDSETEIFDLDGIPPYNQDKENNPPQKVLEFKAKIIEADALIIATPEYNYSIPGVLKNAIDWASRPYSQNVFDEKPVAILGATIGKGGTIKAQFALRQCFVFLNMYPMNEPQIYISDAETKFDDEGLNDETIKDKIVLMLINLETWSNRLKK